VNTDFDAQSKETTETMHRFNNLFQYHDPAALTELVAEDGIIENTVPAPNGARYAGREACIKRYFLRPVGAQNRVRTSGPRRAGTWLDRLVGTFLSE
jgi:hypothetical protein